MYTVFPDGEIDDQDMEQLKELLDVLDHQLDKKWIKKGQIYF